MTYDPREQKLPKWAQEYLAETRRRADLAWPTIPKPHPYCVIDENGHAAIGPKPYNITLWNVTGGMVGDVVVGAGGCKESRGGGFATRLHGAYYATLRDAQAAAWWEACEKAAGHIHAAAEIWRRDNA